jgi:hypothetical protein
MHVVSLCFKCFRCFRRMLHMFHLVVSKVDLGVAHCCKWHTCIFQSHVPSLSSVFRSSVAHAAIEPVADEQRPTAGLCLLPRTFLVRHDAPRPVLSSPLLPYVPLLHLVVAVQARPTSARGVMDVV